jgi:hypothetical protein
MSFPVYREIVKAQSYFIFRVKTGLLHSITETLPVIFPENIPDIFDPINDELICYTNDNSENIYRLVSFSIAKKIFYILTDRRDLTTLPFQCAKLDIQKAISSPCNFLEIIEKKVVFLK